MHRLMQLDVRERLAPVVPALAVEVVCAVACLGASALLRLIAELVTPGVAPFVFSYPAVLLATLMAGWRSGAIAIVIAVAAVWYLFLGPGYGLANLEAGDAATLVFNALSLMMVVGIGQAFRTASVQVGSERAAKIEERDLLLHEINHRVKNNFQMVASLLDIHRRRTPEEPVKTALTDVLNRVRSMAQAHAALYQPAAEIGSVDFAAYLEQLCGDLKDGLLLDGDIELQYRSEPSQMSRDKAVALGLVVNELVTNASKHAFPGGRRGVISVSFSRQDRSWRLAVADDGVGLSPEALESSNGLGHRLVAAFARQAGGELKTHDGPGTLFTIDLPA